MSARMISSQGFSVGSISFLICAAVHSIAGVYYANFAVTQLLFHVFHANDIETESAAVVVSSDLPAAAFRSAG